MAKTIGYMVTWSTYGSWLQGDRRGYVKDGRILSKNKELEIANRKIQPQHVIKLNKEQREIVRDAITGEAESLNQKLYAVAVGSTHVHITIGYNGTPVESLVGRYKTATRLALKGSGLRGKVWTKGYDKRYCFNEAALNSRIEYVNKHGDK